MGLPKLGLISTGSSDLALALAGPALAVWAFAGGAAGGRAAGIGADVGACDATPGSGIGGRGPLRRGGA